MTVTYTLKVSNAALCGFAKLLLRWKGSIYKLLYREMLIFILLYYGLSGLYRYILSEDQRRVFEKIVLYCEAFTDLIPLSFVLGFYVSIVVGRWWQQYMSIPWPDRVVTLIGSHVCGTDERGRMIRRTLARYLNLMTVVTCQSISTSVKKRFPTVDHIVESGLMTPEEKQIYEELICNNGKWWVPAQWFTALLVRARTEGRIRDDVLLKQILDEMLTFRGCCGMLFSYDWISIPLVYTQVVTIAIYTFFLATLMGRQYLDPTLGYKGHEVDLYIPVFTILQFFFYMGWLKVAEQLINPFGEDDDDFELNWIIDRNVQVSFLIVDEMYMKHPPLVKDNFWDELEPQLPYTKSSLNFKTEPHLGSTVDLNVNPIQATFVPMNTIIEEDSSKHNCYSDMDGPLQVSQDTPFLECSSISKKGSMLSLQSVRTTLQELKNNFKGSNLDIPSQNYFQKSTNDIGTNFFHNILNSDEPATQKMESDTLLIPVTTMYSPEVAVDSLPYNSYLQQQTPCSLPFTTDNPLYNSHSPTNSSKPFASLTETLKNVAGTRDTNWPIVEPDNCISFSQDFNNDRWVPEHSNLMHANDAAIVEIQCDNKGSTGSFPFNGVPSNLPVLDLSEADSNQSTVSSVAELLSHSAT